MLNTHIDYPLLDDQWPSRRWNSEHTDYIDLSDTCDCQLCRDVCPVCEKDYKEPNEVMCKGCLAFYADNWADKPLTAEEKAAQEAD